MTHQQRGSLPNDLPIRANGGDGKALADLLFKLWIVTRDVVTRPHAGLKRGDHERL